MTHRPQPVGREAAVKALKKFVRSNRTDFDEQLGDTLVNETDRGVVILTATMVEDVLESALESRMVELSADERARIFEADAPLGTFSAKIRIAQALGIIDREQRIMCDLVRDMRNACAHSRRDISFKNKELRDVLHAAVRYISADEPSGDADSIFHKVELTWLVTWLMRSITSGSKDEASALVQRMVNDMRADIDKRLASRQKRLERQAKDRPRGHKERPPRRPLRSSAE